MEIILTVVITLIVVALIGAGIILITLTKKVQEVEVLKRDIEYINQDLIERINGWVSSTDRRFDKLYNDVSKIDSVINPNKDILKGW